MEYRQSFLEHGRVAHAGEADYIVLTETGFRQAVAAVSCIVRPEKDDLVLLSSDDGDRAFILSVLERKDGGRDTGTLQLHGQVNMDVRGGGFRLTADEDLSFVSQEKVAMASPEIEIDAGEGRIRIEKMSYAGRLLRTHIEKIKVVADAVDTIFRRAVARMTTSYRYIEEHEEIQSASTRMLVDGTLTMQTKNTMHTAEGHIKIDAEQIHLG